MQNLRESGLLKRGRDWVKFVLSGFFPWKQVPSQFMLSREVQLNAESHSVTGLRSQMMDLRDSRAAGQQRGEVWKWRLSRGEGPNSADKA